MPMMPFKMVLSGTGASPLIAHVPHASTLIPPAVRAQIELADDELHREIVRLTDWHADHLFSWVLAYGGALFVNELSRLVFDPERFRDDADEPAAAYGQGVIYTHTSDGRPLGPITPGERQRRLEDCYDEYHMGLTELVRNRLERFGEALILDCHSYPSVPLPTETGPADVRPDICIGTDAFHTPPALVERLVSAFTAEGLTVAVDRPFAGTMVPLEFLGKDKRVRSVMIEVRRDLYCDEATGERTGRFDEVRDAVERAVMGAVGDWAALARSTS